MTKVRNIYNICLGNSPLGSSWAELGLQRVLVKMRRLRGETSAGDVSPLLPDICNLNSEPGYCDTSQLPLVERLAEPPDLLLFFKHKMLTKLYHTENSI